MLVLGGAEEEDLPILHGLESLKAALCPQTLNFGAAFSSCRNKRQEAACFYP